VDPPLAIPLTSANLARAVRERMNRFVKLPGSHPRCFHPPGPMLWRAFLSLSERPCRPRPLEELAEPARQHT
jgi:hypothetical protein